MKLVATLFLLLGLAMIVTTEFRISRCLFPIQLAQPVLELLAHAHIVGVVAPRFSEALRLWEGEVYSRE